MKYYIEYSTYDDNHYKIDGIRMTSDAFSTNHDPTKYHEITKSDAKSIGPIVSETLVKVSRDVIDNSKEFFYFVEKKPKLDIKKDEALKLVNKHYEMVMNSVALFEMYNMMLINNELGANGYFITKENREEVYMDIISSGDKEQITLLKEYLEYRDRIQPMNVYYNKLKDFKKELPNLNTVEEVDEMIHDLTTFMQ